jgi:sterol desaturase/sphingolipid hydroxylase (fatty acid hydroxylase superfamily)
MTDLVALEPWLRAGVFATVLLAMVAWETRAPRRVQIYPRAWRWANNLAIVVVNTMLLRSLFPVAAVGAALLAAEADWGLFNRADLSLAWSIPLTILCLDFAIWAQHVLFHRVPALWRLHRMHHADPEIDASTGLRFHPLEIVLSMLVKIALVLLLGAPAVAVLAFEILLNATSLFNHSNLRLAPKLDAALRWVVVTPDMHRVHHSWHPQETDSNFGFNLTWWDRLFGTYVEQPRDGHERMIIGLREFRDPADLRLDRMLVQPFRE